MILMQVRSASMNCLDLVSMLDGIRGRLARPPGKVGSGKPVKPCERMHAAARKKSCCCWVVRTGLACPAGFRRLQAYVAALARESLTARNARTAAGFAICPLLPGSGKFGTPWARTHWE
jgi:hypothetical protein